MRQHSSNLSTYNTKLICHKKAKSLEDKKLTLLLSLLLAGDIHPHPGPRQNYANNYPCGACEHPVTWSNDGVRCDNCSIWHHRSCLSMCSSDFALLNTSKTFNGSAQNVNRSTLTLSLSTVLNSYYPTVSNRCQHIVLVLNLRT